jgi:hypothetical protein
MTQCRLRDPKLRGRFGEAFLLGDGDKGEQIVDVSPLH